MSTREQARATREISRSLAGLKTKTLRAVVTKSPTDGSGTFVAIVSTFGPPPDLQGDIIDRHAYDRTIVEAKANHPGELWPVWYGHGYNDPANAIGIITNALATDKGLAVEGRLNIDRSPKAMATYEGLLSGAIREWSIGFDVVASHVREWKGQEVRFLDELELLEISSVWSGANRFTSTVDVKGLSEEAILVRRAHEIADASDARSKAIFRRLRDPVAADLLKRLDEATPGRGAKVAPDAVDEFIRQDRERRAREQAEARRIAGLGRAVGVIGGLLPSWEEEKADERADHERFVRDMEQRDREKAEERARLEEIDAQRREWTRNDPNTYTP